MRKWTWILVFAMILMVITAACGQKKDSAVEEDEREFVSVNAEQEPEEEPEIEEEPEQEEEEEEEIISEPEEEEEEETPANGDELTWDANWSGTAFATYDGGKTLTFWGEGAIDPFDGSWIMVGSDYAPWSEYADSITKIVIEDGITGIGLMALEYLGRGVELTIASTVTEIAQPFCGDGTVFSSIRIDGDSSVLYADSKALYVSNSAGGYELARYCGALEDESFELPTDITVTAIRRNAFESSRNLVSIDVSADSIVSIGEDAFIKCYNLERLALPASLQIDDLEWICLGDDNLTDITGGGF